MKINVLTLTRLFNSKNRSKWLIFLLMPLLSSCKINFLSDVTNFIDVCTWYTNGFSRDYSNQIISPLFGTLPGSKKCKSPDLLFSVTHETLQNGHEGDFNNEPGNTFMSDYVYNKDFGRWVNGQIATSDKAQILRMSLDTINFESTTPTGRSIKNGHLFFGINDLTAKAQLSKDIYITFQIRIRGAELNQNLYSGSVSGHRVLVGSLLKWDEGYGRENKKHFLEFDLYQSSKYNFGESINRTYCYGAHYHRCFFDYNGRTAEGKNIDYPQMFGVDRLPLNSKEWVSVSIPLSEIAKELKWYSGPSSWSKATLDGVYIGLESMGASRLWIEVKNYGVYEVVE